MKKTALAIAFILILSSAIVIVFASSMLSNPVHTPNETALKETEPINPTEPPTPTEQPNPTETTNETETTNGAEQWSTPTRITSTVAMGGLCMSADGKRIAFISGFDLLLINTDGTGLKNLTSIDPVALTAYAMGKPSISANGERIAFKASKAVSSGPPSFYHDYYSAIFVVNSDGTGLARLFPKPQILDYEHLPEFQHTISDPFISANGAKIAFVSDSHLYVINSDGTRLTQLSDSIEGTPSISADGNKVAFYYTAGNYSELFIINSDGTELTKVVSIPMSPLNYYPDIFGSNSIGDLRLSGDGNKIAFTIGSQWLNIMYELYVVNSDGTGLTNLCHNVTGTPSISHDGDKIAFISYGSDGRYSINVINSDGSDPAQLSSNAENYIGPWISGDGRKIVFSYGLEYGTFITELGKQSETPEPTPTSVQNSQWSTMQILSLPSTSVVNGLSMNADGRKIAFSAYNLNNENELFVVNSDGTGLIQLSGNIEEATGPSISGDGGKIAFISESDLYLINSDGTDLTKLAPNVKLLPYGYYYSPSISGDGSKVAVIVEVDEGFPSSDLYVINSDGTGLTKLSSDVMSTPSISWDGGKIAFTHYVTFSDELEEIYVVNSDGTGLTQLTSKIGAFPQVTGPVISGDGSKVAVTVQKDRWDLNSYTEVLVVNSDGTGLKQLTSNTWNDYVCSMSYDGSKIAFVSGSGGNSEICVINSDGTGLTQITENSLEDSSPSISRDGSRIAFYEGFADPVIFVTSHE